MFFDLNYYAPAYRKETDGPKKIQSIFFPIKYLCYIWENWTLAFLSEIHGAPIY